MWTDEKQRWAEAERREEQKKEDDRRERVRRKKMQMREKVGKSRNTVFFKWFVAPEGRKVSSLKRRVRSHLARWEMKKCTPLWRQAHFQVKMYKTHQLRTTFSSWDVEKVHTVVARITFRSQNVQNTHQVRTTFGSWDVEKVHAVVVRSTFRSQNVKNTRGSDHFWRFRCASSWQAQGVVDLLSKVSKTWGFCCISNYNHHYTTLHSNTLHYNYRYNFTTFHYTTLYSTTLHYTQLYSITLS